MDWQLKLALSGLLVAVLFTDWKLPIRQLKMTEEKREQAARLGGNICAMGWLVFLLGSLLYIWSL